MLHFDSLKLLLLVKFSHSQLNSAERLSVQFTQLHFTQCLFGQPATLANANLPYLPEQLCSRLYKKMARGTWYETITTEHGIILST